LSLAENHLDSLIQDANKSLALLTTLSTSFKSVEAQTSSFQARCDTLLKDQARLEKLANEVGTSLYYYAYLENVSRRLNAPGAGRLAEHHDLAEVLDDLESCIDFMTKHVC
jgi:3-hydroxyisobutyrate dehydrogenase-like beta-hydroxyacid dehydrogenase